MMNAEGMVRLFFYGTLMDAELLAVVAGRPVTEAELTPARLAGHRRVAIVGQHYPMLVAAPGGAVDGVLCDASADELARIAFFEGDVYALAPHAVTLPGGEAAQAMVCIAGSGLRPAAAAWSIETWRADGGKAAMMRVAPGYMACHGRMSAEAADALWGSAAAALQDG